MSPTVAVFGTLRFPADRVPELIPHLKLLVDATYQHDGVLQPARAGSLSVNSPPTTSMAPNPSDHPTALEAA